MSTGNNKFSKELQTDKRFRLTEQRVTVSEIGAWNPDATDASRDQRDFAEVRNMRKMRPNELETRSGYKQWRFPAFVAASGELISSVTPKAVLARAEYRLDSVFVDVTFFRASVSTGGPVTNWIYALIIQPSQEGVLGPVTGQTPSQVDVGNPKFSQYVAICPCDATPVVGVKQFGTYLVVSCLSRTLPDPQDTGMYALAPAAKDATLQQPWTITTLGKTVSPCPSQINFSGKIQGDLLAIPANDPNLMQNGGPAFTPKLDPATNQPITIPLKVNADYFLAASLITYPVEPLWEYAKRDTPVSEPTDSNLHTKNRGWMYRIVLKKKFTDTRGQEHIVSEAPSADFYVPDMTYGPAGVGVTLNTVLQTVDQIQQIGQFAQGWDFIDNLKTRNVGDKNGGEKNATNYPSDQDLINLANKVRELFPNASSFGDALYFLMVYFGAQNTTFTRGINYINSAPPYLLNATSYQVSNAPNSIFAWANFGITDTDVYAIDIYRTSYTLPDESKDLAAGLPYQPYNYGFVGTLYKADGTFTDNIADANLLFSRSPLDAEGFLAGELAGEILQSYQGMLVAGNVRSKYRVRTPWASAEAFLFSAAAGSSGFNPSPAFDKNASGYNTMWYYAYQDKDGVLSNAAPLQWWVPTSDKYVQNMPPAPINALFVLPRGYSTNVTSAVIYRAQLDGGGVMQVYREATVQLADGIYISDNSATLTLVGTLASLLATDGSLNVSTFTATDDPGSYFWSESGDAWSWPQANYENGTDQDPITGAESEIGPLYVFSDRGVVMTRLNGYQEPVHTAGTGAGCLSRYALVRLDAELFALSSCGMTRIDGSGSFAFPASIQSLIWSRLQERITGMPPFAGIRNLVSIGYLPKRGEMWITFSDTSLVGKGGYFGAMPPATFIVKTLTDTLPDNPYRDEITRRSAYQFDMAVPQPPTLQTTPNMPPVPAGDSPLPRGLVIHLSHADGGMWSAWYDPGTDPGSPGPALVVQDNDRPELPWLGQASLQWQNSAGASGVQKRIDGFRFNGSVRCDLYFLRGMLRTDGLTDPLRNTLRPECIARQVAIQGQAAFPLAPTDIIFGDPNNPNLLGNTAEYELPITHENAIEAVGTPPAIRLVTRCVTDPLNPLFNQHMLRIQSMDMWYDWDHNHKP